MNALAPQCCDTTARLTTGEEIYPHRGDLAKKHFYICDRCRGYVGCHPGTKKTLGTPAGPELRKARSGLHRIIDPLWMTSVKTGGYTPESARAAKKIQSTARDRVYRFIGHHLGISGGDCHTAMFTLEQCARVRELLKGKTYPDIQEWALSVRQKDRAA